MLNILKYLVLGLSAVRPVVALAHAVVADPQHQDRRGASPETIPYVIVIVRLTLDTPPLADLTGYISSPCPCALCTATTRFAAVFLAL
jgi:hypothetical protein